MLHLIMKRTLAVAMGHQEKEFQPHAFVANNNCAARGSQSLKLRQEAIVKKQTSLCLCLLIVFVLFSVPSLSYSLSVPASGQQTFTYPTSVSPEVSTTPASSKPIGVGAVGSGGSTVNIQVMFGQFTGPVDIYLLAYFPSFSPVIWSIKSDNSLEPISLPFSSSTPKWRASTSSPINESLWGNIPVNLLPDGDYYFGALVTPAGSLSDYYLWITSFNLYQKSIVGTWYKVFPPNSNAGSFVTYDPSGVFWHGAYQPVYPDIGFKHGTYTWDPNTGALVHTSIDANTLGDAGPPLGIVSTVTFQNANQILVVNSEGNPFTMYRLTTLANPIVGTWEAFKINQTSGDKVANFVVTPEGYYMLINLDGPDYVDGIPGIEYGTYTFNASTGVFAVTPIVDTSKHWGISPDSSQITFAISGTTMTVPAGDGVTTLQRLEP